MIYCRHTLLYGDGGPYILVAYGVGTVPKQEKVSMSWLLRYLKPVKGRLILLLVLLLTSTGLQLLNPQIVKRFIDTAAEGL